MSAAVRQQHPDDGYHSWQLQGSCQDYPAEWFFPEDEPRKGVRRERERQAKRICLDCPVLARCREHAFRNYERHGVWGAMTGRERALARLASPNAARPGQAS